MHPSGFIDPKSPDDKVKVIGPEALRGLGGIMLNRNGFRFVDDL